MIARLLEHSARPISLLDGDEVRKHLSKGLGFSREDRAANVTRIGYVASEIVRHGGIVVCAPIAPYRDSRAEVRKLIEQGPDAEEVERARTVFQAGFVRGIFIAVVSLLILRTGWDALRL